MKAIIENPIKYGYYEEYIETLEEFAILITAITTSMNREEIELHLNYHKEKFHFKHFDYGFGGNHFWAKQVGNENRIILVELD